MSVLTHATDDTHEPEPADAVVAVEPEGTGYVRSPQFLARLVASAVVFAVLVLAVRFLDQTLAGVDADVHDLVAKLPLSIATFLDAWVLTMAVLIIVGAVGFEMARRRLRMVVLVVSAAALGLGVTLTTMTLLGLLPSVGATQLAVAATSAAIAVLVLTTDDLPRTLSRAAWLLLVPVAVILAAWRGPSAATQLVVAVGGMVIGAAVALLGGTVSRAPTAASVGRALWATGLPVATVMPHDADARASVPWMVELATGRRVFVKTHSAEERSADLLFRLSRLIRLRGTDDARPESSLRRAVEHEAFVASRAAAVGVRTPRLIAVGRIDDNRGIFAAYEAVEGESFVDVADKLTDAQLRAVWSMVGMLHRAGIAHRDLRAANLLLDAEGDPWIVDFGFAEVAASEQQQQLDLVELVASTAVLVGVDRAVAAGFDVFGPDPWTEALPFIQPAALSNATRKAIGDDLDAVRQALLQGTRAPEPDEPRMQRVQPKTLLTILALGIAVWVLLPQVARSADLWTNVRQAQLSWVAFAFVASVGTYVAATVALLGAVSRRVPFLPTLVAQVASSFTNRITPANIGGAALNVRYLARAGGGTAPATTAVGLSTVAGGVVHLIMTLLAVTWAGSEGLGGIPLPERGTVAITGAAALALVALGVAVPASRRLFREHLAGPLKDSVRSVAQVARQPTKLAMLFGGSLLVTLMNLAAMVVSLRAFGAAPALSTVAVVYLAGATVASAAPTPGGLGATEAALVAGLTATGTPESAAVAGVLLYRLATFWVPILPGWISFWWLQRAGRI